MERQGDPAGRLLLERKDMGLIDKEELIAEIEMDLKCSVTGEDNAQAVKAMMQRLYDDVREAPEAAAAVYWRTDPCDTRGEVMVTCKSGRSRWVLPGCYYRRGQWWHTIIEAHDREIDPEGDVEHIGEQEERVMAEVVAWAEYPDPFGMEEE